MQTSVFKLPISPVTSGQKIIDELDELNYFEKQFLLAPLNSIDFTDRGVTIDGKLYEEFVDVSLEDMMEIEKHHPINNLDTLWEQGEENERGKRALADTKDMLSAEPQKDKYFGLQEFDHMDNKITDKDMMEYKLSPSMSENVEDYVKTFSKVGHISLLVENNNTEMGFVKVNDILKSLVKHMTMANEGLIHKWTYRKRKCFALLDWLGCWNLYAVAPMKYVDDARPRTYNDPPTHFLAWDDDNYLYNIVLDLRTDVMLPNLATDEARPGSTFKDLSYCKAYVNVFVDGIRRGN